MTLNKVKRISVGTFLVLWTAMYGSCIYNNHQESERQEKERIIKIEEIKEKKKQDTINLKKQQEEKNKKISDIKKHFNENKNNILDNINELIDKDDFSNANLEIEKYTTWIQDPALKEILNKLEIKKKENALKTDIDLDKKIDITKELLKISNDNKYTALLKLLIDKKKTIDRQNILSEINKTDRDNIYKNYELYSNLYANFQPLNENETKELAYFMAEKTLLENRKLQFRRIDGSNILVVAFVKTVMNDPDSFEHINTTVYKTHDKAFLDVVMIYRGKNAFGAKVVNTIKARVSLISNTIISVDNE